MDEIDVLAKTIWNYHQVNSSLKKADCILALGSHDLRVADRAADLFLDGWAPLLIVSGKRGNLTTHWNTTEAHQFRARALCKGVPERKIYVEDKATNTGENFTCTEELIRRERLELKVFIVVHKPYMERRALATGVKRWPNKELIVTSPRLTFECYPTAEITKSEVIEIILSDLQKIKKYSRPEYAFQIEQQIPRDVCIAYRRLRELGFTKRVEPDCEI
jgi:uncharacterized SAM-binding protein YcdF (DUF218 family)